MHVVVIADGHVPTRASLDDAWPGWADEAMLVVGADGGALAAEPLGLTLDLVVGDGDSAGEAALERLAASGVEVRRSPSAKDESDTELAVLAALLAGADRVTILGGLGGRRLDHELANVALLAHPALAGIDAVLLDDGVRLSLLAAGPGGAPARRELPGPIGGIVSLLPLDANVQGVTTAGLEYPLRDEPLPLGPARGLSNVRSAPDAAVTIRGGRLLVVELAAGQPIGVRSQP